MLTKVKITFLRDLQNKKERSIQKKFLVEGKKSILECIQSNFHIVEGFFTHQFIPELQINFPYELISQKELQKITTLTSNRDGLLVVEIPQQFFDKKTNKLTLILDGINDPGNLGTIIRIADWYGIENIIASTDTVDCYNSKVIMATMGSFSRVKIFYCDLEQFLRQQSGKQILGATLNGKNLYRTTYNGQGGFLIIGSESHGIRAEIEPYLTDKVMIPRIGGAESLNAGVATGIILDRLLGK